MTLDEALAIGKVAVSSGYLAQEIKRPEQAAMIILAGHELGLPPMAALRSIQIVRGKVSEAADSQLARFKAAGGRARVVEHSDTACSIEMTHPNGDAYVSAYTMDDAKRASLLGSATWKAHPRAMLRSRAITAGLKTLGWSGGAGVYDPDETREIAAPASPPAPEPASAALVPPRRAPTPEPVALPDLAIDLGPIIEANLLDAPTAAEHDGCDREPGDDTELAPTVEPEIIQLDKAAWKPIPRGGELTFCVKTSVGMIGTRSKETALTLQTALDAKHLVRVTLGGECASPKLRWVETAEAVA